MRSAQAGLFLPQALLHHRRHETADRAAETEHFFDQPRAGVGVLLGRHQKHRFQIVIQPPVHQRHLELVLEVRDGTQAADQRLRAFAPRVVDEQSIEGVHLDVVPVAEHLADHRHALVDREERRLVGVDEDGDDNPIEDRTGALDDVDVAAGERIEGPGKDGDARGTGRLMRPRTA